jgi:DNA-binding transcriptional ArsR family regulator
MARTSTTFDTFNAIAEPKRRVLIEILIKKEQTVSEIVAKVGWNQPMVSKHLKVLKQVDIVSERKQGRFHLYRVNPIQLKPLQDWVCQFEKYWENNLDNLENYLNKIQSQGDSRE